MFNDRSEALLRLLHADPGGRQKFYKTSSRSRIIATTFEVLQKFHEDTKHKEAFVPPKPNELVSAVLRRSEAPFRVCDVSGT